MEQSGRKGGVDPSATDIARLIDRRTALLGMAAMASAGAVALSRPAAAQQRAAQSSLRFQEIAHGTDKTHGIAPGYRADVLIRWGDPVLEKAAPFDPRALGAAAQQTQFGYNNDFLAFMPLPPGSRSSDHGLLCVNHEYTNPTLMWEQLGPDGKPTAAQTEVEMAALGLSVVEIRRESGRWRVVAGSRYARRISTSATRIAVSGPAAGHARLRTTADPTGKSVLGTLANCAGGVTPWGTVLSAEEGFDDHFLGDAAKAGSEARNHRRYGLKGRPWHRWGRFVDRFDIEKEPNEPNRFGWVVEIDPYDPAAVPVKRTALGRCKHESATVVVNGDGRVVVYSGDDEREEYLYRYVSNGRLDPGNREANRGLLDDGVLSVAKFGEDGKLRWLPLVLGQGKLNRENGFPSQADILVDTRLAADALGATTMDRPEDIEVSPVTGKVYVVLTGDGRRKEMKNVAGPRARNPYGHILELLPPLAGAARDHTAATFDWGVFLLAGDPAAPEHEAKYPGAVSREGWLTNPDNLAFDGAGRLWIATDGQPASVKFCDSLYATDTEGPGRGAPRLFFNGPVGCEITGPTFAPDDRTLFLAIQHPGEDSNLPTPSTRWPDFSDAMPPRPAVVAITKEDGGPIGS